MAAELFEDRQIRLALERGEQTEADFWRRVKADVDQAPPLSAEVRDRLAIILRQPPAASAPVISKPRQRAATRQAA